MSMDNKRSEITQILAEKLPILRKVYGVSQERLGELLGKSRQQISLFERKIVPLGWDTSLAIVFLCVNKNRALFNEYMGSEFLEKIKRVSEPTSEQGHKRNRC